MFAFMKANGVEDGDIETLKNAVSFSTIVEFHHKPASDEDLATITPPTKYPKLNEGNFTLYCALALYVHNQGRCSLA